MAPKNKCILLKRRRYPSVVGGLLLFDLVDLPPFFVPTWVYIKLYRMNTIWWGVYVYVEVIYMRQLLCVLNVTTCIERIRFGGVYVYVSVFYVLVTVCIECYQEVSECR